MAASYCWERRHTDSLPINAHESLSHQTEQQISILWTILFEPLLFGIIGTALNFDLIPRGSVLQSLTIIFVGICVRLPAAYFATRKNDLTRKERIFISLSWLPKATVQAALCSFPLIVIKDVMDETDELFSKYVEWGNQILSTSILSIIMTAPLGLLAIEHLGPRLLSKDDLVPLNLGKTDPSIIKRNASNEINREDSILHCIGKLDILMQTLANSSDAMECKCLIAEARKRVWRCKTILTTTTGTSVEEG